ncbi:hypothetical protein RJT34_02162 [Clitoria ternatea]|uniref:Uncharacterized protein n=1 Tax=Clitoria ternatea TaxID=43366 RepID=A0AAN9KGX5_CLITE
MLRSSICPPQQRTTVVATSRQRGFLADPVPSLTHEHLRVSGLVSGSSQEESLKLFLQAAKERARLG